ncbi:S53 family peptidase [Actinoallomurus iriomotensis]|uniref:Peptidase S53 domain-containing protein n=1 Tax=Actinoallomurus iriomotensis TaxID=478107 RepID=A0A9W6S9D5_9ACTN|nr:S53 family peptidase [Actinoallomurus iriomotensis]GLY89463.1 hypothetical protein Airi02_073920 [Actinoallomurus iriomotensis]
MLIVATGCAPTGAQTARAVAASPPESAATDCDSLATCYTPRRLRVAYGIQPLLDRGIDGRGRTIMVPALGVRQPASSPKVSDIRQDMHRFDDLFGLPAVRLKIDTTLAGDVSPRLAGLEEVQDVQILHALAPAATIRVVLVEPTALNSPASATAALTGALRRGLSHADVISISAGWGEHCLTRAQITRQHAVLRAARDRHVTVVAGSGDTGAVSRPCPGSQSAWTPVKEVSAPASDPLVLAAGGTLLTAHHRTGAYIGETTWSVPTHSQGTGGGFSHLFARPGYQDDVTGTNAGRAVPDVAADAAPSTGMALVISENGQEYKILGASGTSASTPLWAALVALADQAAGQDLGFVNPAIYRIGRSGVRDAAFHDMTMGNNTVTVSGKTINGYRARPGYDPVTGWGSPDARVLVPLLARHAGH